MEFTYRKASPEDLDILTETRITVLRAANGLDDSVDMSEVEEQSRQYYRQALADGSHAACLVFDGDSFIGAGGISFFRVMPTVHNPTGWKAYIMNMYTAPEYRRKGIAFHTLSLLVAEARRRGIHAISLEATDAGRPLYEKFGFVPVSSEMELPESSPIARIAEMESDFDFLLSLWKHSPDSFGRSASARAAAEKLTGYYEGDQWMADYRMDELGHLPPELKRGVLSEDGLYNFLEEIRDVRWEV